MLIDDRPSIPTRHLPKCVIAGAAGEQSDTSESAPGLPTVLLMDSVPRRHRDGSLPENIGIAGVSIAWVRESRLRRPDSGKGPRHSYLDR